MALVKKNDFDIEFEIENTYREVLQKYFEYNDIHFTFIGLNNFDTVFYSEIIYLDIFLESYSKLIKLNYKINK